MQGAGVHIPASNTVRFSNRTISNSVGLSTFNGGGGIYNAGTCYLYRTAVTRNPAQFGGFLNTAGGKMYIESSTFTENRSLSPTGGGGGGESNTSGSVLYVNNSSFCSNQATSGGGGINNYGGATAYIANTTFAGNIVDDGFQGGGLCNISGSSYLLNCLFAYNYYKSAPGSGAPTTLSLNDILAYSGAVNMYYCTYMTAPTGGGTVNYAAGNTLHALAPNGSTNDLFTGGVLTTMYGTNGQAYGTAQYFQPYLIKVNGIAAPTLKTGSWALGQGVLTGFTNGGAGSPSLGYYNGSSWVNVLGTAASANPVTDDETGTVRPGSRGVGAIERTVDNCVSLKVFANPNGTVSNASIYGDLYPTGTSVTITAVPNNGYAFSNFAYNLGGSGTLSSNPLTVTLNQNTIFTPNFSSTTNFMVVYLDNGSTGGTLPSPAASAYSSGSTASIASNTGNLIRERFTFGGWNTQPNGSGITYNPGGTHSSSLATNLTLYAVWTSTGLPLPVNLLRFDAMLKAPGSVRVDWTTAAEINSDYFELERSSDARDWAFLAKVIAAGMPPVRTTHLQTFSLLTANPFTV